MAGCNCQSYNKPEWGGDAGEVPIRCDVDPLVPIDKRRVICVDACIVDQIKALWAKGIETGGCCCGHNKDDPNVGLLRADAVPMAVEVLKRSDTRTWKVWAYSR